MQFVAKAKYIRFSPYKLRLLVDAVRGKKVTYALAWLSTTPVKRAVPITKIIKSAVANAKDLKNIDVSDLAIKEIRVDQGPMFKYFKPGPMGRANVQKKRLCHMSVVLESIKPDAEKEA